MPQIVRPVHCGSCTEPFQESAVREMPRLGDEAGAVNLSQGLAAFRAAITGKYQAADLAADPEMEVTAAYGVSDAMMSTLPALTDPGGEVIIIEPWYENSMPGCQMARVIPKMGCKKAAEDAPIYSGG